MLPSTSPTVCWHGQTHITEQNTARFWRLINITPLSMCRNA